MRFGYATRSSTRRRPHPTTRSASGSTRSSGSSAGPPRPGGRLRSRPRRVVPGRQRDRLQAPRRRHISASPAGPPGDRVHRPHTPGCRCAGRQHPEGAASSALAREAASRAAPATSRSAGSSGWRRCGRAGQDDRGSWRPTRPGRKPSAESPTRPVVRDRGRRSAPPRLVAHRVGPAVELTRPPDASRSRRRADHHASTAGSAAARAAAGRGVVRLASSIPRPHPRAARPPPGELSRRADSIPAPVL
jgi:hypothetical protein